MARRKLEEINASSMADIAFLLLIFFLIATTMDKDQGLSAVLPQKNESTIIPPKVKERNLFQIIANRNNQLLIENDWAKLPEVKGRVKEFMLNPENKENLPELTIVNSQLCKERIATFKSSNLAASSVLEGYNLQQWEDLLFACEMLGESIRVLPPVATISIQYDLSTSYGTYVELRDQIKAAINELRDDKCFEVFGVTYTELEAKLTKTEEDKNIMNALRTVFPERIIKQPPRNV